MILQQDDQGLYCRVEHVDTDCSGVMHFSRHASLMESAVLEMFEQRDLGLTKFYEKNYDLRIANLQIKYKSPAYFRDLLLCQVKIDRVGHTCLRVKVELSRCMDNIPNEIISEGTLDIACVDLKSGQLVKIPENFNQYLQEECYE